MYCRLRNYSTRTKEPNRLDPKYCYDCNEIIQRSTWNIWIKHNSNPAWEWHPRQPDTDSNIKARMLNNILFNINYLSHPVNVSNLHNTNAVLSEYIDSLLCVQQRWYFTYYRVNKHFPNQVDQTAPVIKSNCDKILMSLHH